LSPGQTPNRRVSHHYYYPGRSAYHYYYRGRSAYHYYYRERSAHYCYHNRYFQYQDNLHFLSRKIREVSFQELITMYKEYLLSQPCICYIVITKDYIKVLEP
jgi:hypothetical protein